jgi:hypothetical protein
MSLSLSPNSLYRQTTDCTEGGGLTREHCTAICIHVAKRKVIAKFMTKCRCLGDKPSINDGLKYLKYCIKIEKTTINFLYTKRMYM